MSYIIGIVGTSGSGKTTLAKHLHSLYPDSIALLSLDNYYIGKKPEETLDEYSKRNFDVPEALDLELFCADLARLKEGHSIHTPFYDMKNDFTSYPNRIEITAKPIIIIEGTLLFSDFKLANLIDFKVFMKLSSGPALCRRLLRDTTERNLNMENALRRYESDIFASYTTHIKPYKYRADLVINTNATGYRQEDINTLKACIEGVLAPSAMCTIF